MRVSAPLTGTDLPTILLSHGHGAAANGLGSLDSCLPLAKVWAARGFVVIQPDHLSAPRLKHLVGDRPEAPLFLRSRAEDMITVFGPLDEITQAVPQLAGRMDRSRSRWPVTPPAPSPPSFLLGARITDLDTNEVVDLLEPRITQGVLIGATGRGGRHLRRLPSDQAPVFRTVDLTTMVTPAPVVAGDEEDSQHWTTMRPDWHTDPTASPRVEDPAHVFDGELLFGGIHGHDSAETTDESPDRVAGVAELTAVYLRTAFDPADNAWQTARDALTTAKAPSAASGRSNPLAGEQAHQQPTTERKMSRVAHTQHFLGSGFSAASTADDVIGGIDLTARRPSSTAAMPESAWRSPVHSPVRERPDRAAAALAEAGLSSVEVDRLDLLDPASVSAFADHWLETDRPPHILVNCAGVTPPMRLEHDARGYEVRFATNHLGHFQLTLTQH